MSGIMISLVTYGFVAVIGMGIAAVIWALPKIIDLLPNDEKKK